MKKQTYTRAVKAGCLLLALVCSLSLPTAAATSGEATKKDETVYVNLSADGNVQSTTVSDWLHSDTNSVRIADRSNLSDITNVKSSDQPIKSGNNLTWVLSSGNSDSGTDVYYQGKTTAATPLNVSVSYTLDGKTIKPDQIAGKSGKVTITVNLENTDSHTVQVDGKSVVMYTPMTAIVAATLPSDTFSNVTVNKGKVISDGSNQFVTFLSMPGLSESLDLKNCGVEGIDSIDLPEDLVITADAKDFTLGSIAIAATPELPTEDELGSEDSFDDLKEDLDKLSDMQDDLNSADPDKDIRSLFTNPDRTAAARLIVDDVFNFYNLDTAALDIMPKYVTDDNISLYDRVTSDIDKADLKYVIDNKVIRGLNDRLTDENISKAKTLLSDYDDIETFQIGKLDRVIHVLDSYDKQYDHLNDALKDAQHIVNRLDTSDVDTLAALSDSDVQSSLAGTLKSMKALSSSGLLSSSFQLNDDDVEALMKSILSTHSDLLESALESQLDSMKDDNDYISVSDLLTLLEKSGLDSSTITGISDTMSNAILSNSSSKAAIPQDDLVTLMPALSGASLDSLSDGNGNIYIQKLLSAFGSSIDSSTQSALIPYVLIPEDEVESMMQSLLSDDNIKSALLSGMMDSSTISSLTDSLNSLLSNSANLNTSLTDELGSNYASRLTSAMSNMSSVKSYIDDMQDELDDLDEDEQEDLEDDFEDAKALLQNKDDMDYLITWAKKLRDMKGDMDDNTDNISILRDLINLNDDTKIKTFRSMIPTLLTDFDDSRPILDSIKDELDQPAVNASLHKMPQTTKTLTKMENDIRSNRDIMDIFRLTTQSDTVAYMNDALSKLDEFQEKGTTDNLQTLMDKKDAYSDLSDQYTIFTEAADGAETNVKFVYKTAEIDKPDTEDTKVVSTTSTTDNSSSGLFGWIRSAWESAANVISHLF